MGEKKNLSPGKKNKSCVNKFPIKILQLPEVSVFCWLLLEAAAADELLPAAATAELLPDADEPLLLPLLELF